MVKFPTRSTGFAFRWAAFPMRVAWEPTVATGLDGRWLRSSPRWMAVGWLRTSSGGDLVDAGWDRSSSAVVCVLVAGAEGERLV